MAAPVQEQRLFFITGRRQDEGVDAIDDLALRPALLARFRDLTRLRYDFPLVLVGSGPAAGTIRSLSSLVDELLCEVAPRGLDGERLRRHVLRLEREIRARCAAGARGSLSELWIEAAERLAVPDDPSAVEVLAHVLSKLKVDGEIVDCDASTGARIATHLWQAAQQRKGAAFRADVERLVVRLSDILRAAFLHSEAGRAPESLRAAVGGAYRDAFDFDVMSTLVGRKLPKDDLPPARRARIERTLDVLKAQRFFPDSRRRDAGEDGKAFTFRFDACADAANAFRSRLPELAEVVKTIAIGELEADGQYVEAKHDVFFAHFDADALTADDIALFPDYLVCIPAGQNDAPGNAGLMDVLSAGLPLKVLVETNDLVEDAAVGTGHFAFGVRSMRLANTATALGGVFVVQAASSHLHALRERLERAFAHRGAALVSVYAGAATPSGALAPYLTAAAAMESRAFPAFTYDPYAGDNQAARFSLVDNPQPEADWPVATLEFADENGQRVAEETAFTIADFMLCDRRYADHFALSPIDRWNAAMIPADEWLACDPKARQDLIPYVLAVDADDVLHRLIVDSRLMQVAERCRTFWRRLQEQGGIHNSHAQILLAREKARWDEVHAQERSATPTESGAPIAAATLPSAPEAAGKVSATEATAQVAAPAERNSDEAWIETARCPSCDECQTINDRMFRYNENKQAYIADVNAGTYRELVEAAEVCQVAIIHPGKPRNPEEPGLAGLVERAASFI